MIFGDYVHQLYNKPNVKQDEQIRLDIEIGCK